MKPTVEKLLLILFLLLISYSGLAHELKVGDLVIDHPYARETPPGATVSAGYLKISNNGTEDDRLIAVTTESTKVKVAEIHEMSMADGMMMMSELEGGVLIPADESIELKPEGLHIMFMGIQQPFKQGETITAKLTFEKAGTVIVTFKIKKI
jgi:copper(I)-binding protein